MTRAVPRLADFLNKPLYGLMIFRDLELAHSLH
jgi:hypothetical protein